MADPARITLDSSAAARIEELRGQASDRYLRLAVEGGGCAGFQYSWDFDDKFDGAADILIDDLLLIDKASLALLTGAVIRYAGNEIEGGRFVIDNPNAESSCGCGSSFSVSS